MRKTTTLEIEPGLLELVYCTDDDMAVLRVWKNNTWTSVVMRVEKLRGLTYRLKEIAKDMSGV